MKASKSLLAGVLLIGFLFCWGVVAHADPSVWPKKQGEICLYNDSTEGSAKIAVVKTVGSNYLIQGVSTDSDGEQTLFDGNAVVQGDLVLMNISGSGYDPSEDEVHGIVGTVELNLDSGSGWVKMVGFHCIGNGPYDPTDDEPNCSFSNDGTQDLFIILCE